LELEYRSDAVCVANGAYLEHVKLVQAFLPHCKSLAGMKTVVEAGNCNGNIFFPHFQLKEL
jgi:hypothetical protein